MGSACARHRCDRAVDTCHDCGSSCCAACVVYPADGGGARCVHCAVVAAGVRARTRPERRVWWRRAAAAGH